MLWLLDHALENIKDCRLTFIQIKREILHISDIDGLIMGYGFLWEPIDSMPLMLQSS